METRPSAPWRQWRRVAVAASREKPVRYDVEGFDPRRNARYGEAITRAAQRYFGIDKVPPPGEDLAAYIGERGLLRVAYRELVVRFRARVGAKARGQILRRFDLDPVARSPLTSNQWIVRHAGSRYVGATLMQAADSLAAFPEVVFAWPSLASELKRAAPSLARRWPLDAIRVNYSTGNRRLPRGDPAVIVAVLDDGVDLAHPNLSGRLCTQPDPQEPLDAGGRDYTLPASDPGHFDPRPKLLPATASSDDNDWHGTACAGLVVSDASKGNFLGVAPGCRFVAVKVFNGDELTLDTRVADAIRYAARVADVVACSWNGEEHADVEAAAADAARGRGRKGTALFCAAGNDEPAVGFPASLRTTIGIGACTSEGAIAGYSSAGKGLDLVAPSSGGARDVFTTDVGDNKGLSTAAGAGDLFWPAFGGTSAATAIAAGVGALCLSVNPSLTRHALRKLLRKTAERICADHDPRTGFSPSGGYGRIDAAAAVAAARAAR